LMVTSGPYPPRDGQRALRGLALALTEPALLYPLRRLSTSLEMLDTATLIHDDLINGAAQRLDRAPLHTTWSAGATVLNGDYLLAEATASILMLDAPPVGQLCVDTLKAVRASEIQRLAVEHRSSNGASTGHVPAQRKAYYRTIEAKRATFFAAAAARMAVVLAGAVGAGAGIRVADRGRHPKRHR